MEEDYLLLELDEAMDMTGFGKFNIGILLLCGTMFMGMMFETLGLGYVMPVAQCDLKLSLTDKGWLGAIPFIAIIITSHMWGWLADTRGRKKTLMYSMLIGAILTICSSFSSSLTSFAVMRMIAGIFNSSTTAVSFVYLAEFNPKKYQSKMVTLGSSFIPIATVIMPIFAWILLPLDYSWYIYFLDIDYRPWRMFVAFCSLPYIICGIILCCGVPESPKLLYANGKHEEAMSVIRTINRINNSPSIPDNVLLKRNLCDNREKSKKSILQSMKEHTVPLFKKPFVMWILILFIAQFTNFACANGFYIWYPQIFNKLSNQAGDLPISGKTICEIYNTPMTVNIQSILPVIDDWCDDTVDILTYQRAIVMGLIFCPSTFIAAFFVNMLGNKYMLISMSLISGISGFIAGFIPNHYIVLICLGLFQMSSTCISLLSVVILDLFPTNIRAMAVSLTMMFGRFGSIFGSNVIGIMMEKTCSGTFVLFGGMLIGSSLLCLLLPSKYDHKISETPERNDQIIELKPLTEKFTVNN